MPDFSELRAEVCRANLELHSRGLIVYSWGNVSGIDRSNGVIAIKPSGIAYNELTPEKIVVLDLGGEIVEGDLVPSSDTPTHLELYRQFKSLGGICHTHSLYATMWAQACREIPCLGTTHADHFHGAVPVTEAMTAEQIEANYEASTGQVIVERFREIDPMEMPAVLVASHGPFAWGKTPDNAVKSAVILEQVARMAMGTLLLENEKRAISQTLLDKQFSRKHGANA